jgi:hypothetical protein
MSVALSVAARLRHSLMLTFSPSYRQVRQRLEAIGRPVT